MYLRPHGLITEGSHSNIFLLLMEFSTRILNRIMFSQVLPGKTYLRIALESGIQIREEALQETGSDLFRKLSLQILPAEVTPVTELGGNTLGEGVPGPMTRIIRDKFDNEIIALKENINSTSNA